jgi:HSP20 family protein
MSVLRYDPFRELDRFSDQIFGPASRTPWMPMDAVRHGDRVELRFDVPGVGPDAIDVSVERNVLTVKAERSWWPAEGDEVLARERAQGTYQRQVMLGDGLDPERLDAHYEQGVLTLVVPVAEQAKPRKVEIRTSDPAPIEA